MQSIGTPIYAKVDIERINIVLLEIMLTVQSLFCLGD